MTKFGLVLGIVVIGLVAPNAFAAYVNAAFPKETVEKTVPLQKKSTTLKDILQANHSKIPPIQ